MPNQMRKCVLSRQTWIGKIRLCVVSLGAYPLLARQNIEIVGGAELQSVLLAKKLAQRGFDIFLDRGHLSWVLYPVDVCADAILIVLITLLGALGPAQSAQSIAPVVSLRAE